MINKSILLKSKLAFITKTSAVPEKGQRFLFNAKYQSTARRRFNRNDAVIGNCFWQNGAAGIFFNRNLHSGTGAGQFDFVARCGGIVAVVRINTVFFMPVTADCRALRIKELTVGFNVIGTSLFKNRTIQRIRVAFAGNWQ